MSQSGIPIVEDVAGAVGDIGSSIDDFVNDVVPFGWYGVAAATGLYYAPEIAALADAAETAAIAEGATATEAANIGAAAAADAAATTAQAQATDYLGSMALGGAETGAVGTGATGTGLSAGTVSGGVTGTGLNTGALGGMEYLGGAGSLLEGTAGLTAEQIAQAQTASQVGSNVASGTGYLGGAEALPSGTAGITGVAESSPISIQQALRGANLAKNLLGQQPQVAGMPQRQIQPYGVVDYSPTLSLLQMQARKPNVYSLLG